MDVNSPGPLCEEIGLYGEILALDSIELMPTIDYEKVSKGVVLELSQFRRSNKFSWSKFHSWMKAICPESTLPPLPAMKSSIYRIENKIKQLKRNHRGDDIVLIKNEPFITGQVERQYRADEEEETYPLPVTNGNLLPEIKAHNEKFDSEVLTTVNKALACELSTVQNTLELEEAKTNELTAKLSKLSVRNTNKKLKRRDEKITELKEQVADKEKLQHSLNQATARIKHYQYKLGVAKSKYDTISDKCDHLKSVAQDLNEEVVLFKNSLQGYENEYICLLERLQELESHTFKTKEHQRKYLDNVRQCCIELLSLNVGIKNVDPIIRCVLKHIASFEIKELPQTTTLARMYAEMKGLACQQLSEELQKEDNLTLHSDGTSKFGKHYYSFQVSTSDSTYSLGLAEMLSGSATQVLSTFQQILFDLELTVQSGSSDVILSKIKNTMSDRHIVEKNFNALLEGYRLEVLPSVIDNWAELNVDEQQSISTLNNFFCGLHLLVGMADTASSTLLQWELTHFEESVGAAALFGSIKNPNLASYTLLEQHAKHFVSMEVNRVVYTNHSLHFWHQKV